MNKILEYNVTGQNIELSSAAMLVAGTVNEYTARFAFGADWDGYQRVAVFSADGTEREQLLTDDTCKVPWEVLLPGAYLKVGVYGTKDGSRLPTIWTSHRQYIHDGAGPTEEAADPSPVLAEQILQRMGDLDALKTEDKSSLVAAINEVQETGGGGGTSDHSKLKNRDAADQHPMSAITGLVDALAGKQPTGDYLTEELDPTVPEWAKQPQKPAYTAQEVGALPATTPIPSTAADVNAEPSGAVSQHNAATDAHNDIRLLIQGLSERLSAVADSDDTTLDQLSEIVAYIKSNRDLISSVTTDKVSVTDIVDDLTTNVANKPLSAAQGVALKALIDALTDAMPEPYTLPVASSAVLGGVKPVAKTEEMTQPVGVDDAGALWAKAASGGGSADEVLFDVTLTEDASVVVSDAITKDNFLSFLSRHNRIDFSYLLISTTDETVTDKGAANFGLYRKDWNQYYIPVLSLTNNNASNVVPNYNGEEKTGVGFLAHDGQFFKNDFTYQNMNLQVLTVNNIRYMADTDWPSETLLRASTSTVFGTGSRFRVVGK